MPWCSRLPLRYFPLGREVGFPDKCPLVNLLPNRAVHSPTRRKGFIPRFTLRWSANRNLPLNLAATSRLYVSCIIGLGDQSQLGRDFLMAVFMAVGYRQTCYIVRLCEVVRCD